MQRALPTLPAHPVMLRLLRPACHSPPTSASPPADEIKFAWKIQRDMAERGHSLESIKVRLSLCSCDSGAVIQEGWGCGCSARQWQGPEQFFGEGTRWSPPRRASLCPAVQAPLLPQRCLECRGGGHSQGAAEQRLPCAVCLQASIEARKPDFDAFIDPQKKKADMIIQVGAGCLGAGRVAVWEWVALHCLRWVCIAVALSPQRCCSTLACLRVLNRHAPATAPAPPAGLQVLPTQLVPDEKEGKILRVRLIMKEGKKLFDPVYLFDQVRAGGRACRRRVPASAAYLVSSEGLSASASCRGSAGSSLRPGGLLQHVPTLLPLTHTPPLLLLPHRAPLCPGSPAAAS